MLIDGSAKTLWCVASGFEPPAELAAHVELVTLPLEGGRFQPEALLGMLRARGLGRVLIEGGGRTVSDFLAAGLLDRLYLTTAAILVGDGIPGVRFAGADLLADALTASVRRFILGRDICTVFDFAAARHDSAGDPPRQGQDVEMPNLDQESPARELGAS